MDHPNPNKVDPDLEAVIVEMARVDKFVVAFQKFLLWQRQQRFKALPFAQRARLTALGYVPQ